MYAWISSKESWYPFWRWRCCVGGRRWGGRGGRSGRGESDDWNRGGTNKTNRFQTCDVIRHEILWSSWKNFAEKVQNSSILFAFLSLINRSSALWSEANTSKQTRLTTENSFTKNSNSRISQAAGRIQLCSFESNAQKLHRPKACAKNNLTIDVFPLIVFHRGLQMDLRSSSPTQRPVMISFSAQKLSFACQMQKGQR